MKEKAKYKVSPRGKKKLLFQKKSKDHVKLPLIGKTIFLDVKEAKHQKKLHVSLKRLGATIEEFVSKDINYLITSQPRPKVRKDARDNEATPSPFNCDPSPSPGNVEDPKASTVTRGKALAEKARTKTRETTTMLDNAERWGVKIVNLEAAYRWIDKANKDFKHQLKDVEKNDKVLQKQKYQNAKYKLLEKPFIKFESVDFNYRPVSEDTLTWPNFDVLTPRGSCPFDGTILKGDDREEVVRAQVDIPSENTPEEEKDGIDSNSAKHNTEKSTKKSEGDGYTGWKVLTAGELRRRAEQKRRQRKKRGHCECCKMKYEDLDKHVREEQHRLYVKEKSNYQHLDSLIGSVPCTADFLHRWILASVSKNSKDGDLESDENHSQEKVLPKSPRGKRRLICADNKLTDKENQPSRPNAASPTIAGQERLKNRNENKLSSPVKHAARKLDAGLEEDLQRNDTDHLRRSPRKSCDVSSASQTVLSPRKFQIYDAYLRHSPRKSGDVSSTSQNMSPRKPQRVLSPRKFQIYDAYLRHSPGKSCDVSSTSQNMLPRKSQRNDSVTLRQSPRKSCDNLSVNENVFSPRKSERMASLASPVKVVNKLRQSPRKLSSPAKLRSPSKTTERKALRELSLSPAKINPERSSHINLKEKHKQDEQLSNEEDAKLDNSNANVTCLDKTSDFVNNSKISSDAEVSNPDISKKNSTFKKSKENSQEMQCVTEELKSLLNFSKERAEKSGSSDDFEVTLVRSVENIKLPIEAGADEENDGNENDEFNDSLSGSDPLPDKDSFDSSDKKNNMESDEIVFNIKENENKGEEGNCLDNELHEVRRSPRKQIEHRNRKESSLEHVESDEIEFNITESKGQDGTEDVSQELRRSRKQSVKRNRKEDASAHVETGTSEIEFNIKEKDDTRKEHRRSPRKSRNDMRQTLSAHVDKETSEIEFNIKAKDDTAKQKNNDENENKLHEHRRSPRKSRNNIRETSSAHVDNETSERSNMTESHVASSHVASSVGYLDSDIPSDFQSLGPQGEILMFSKTLAERIKERGKRRGSVDNYNINLITQSAMSPRSGSVSIKTPVKPKILGRKSQGQNSSSSGMSQSLSPTHGNNAKSAAQVASQRICNKYKNKRNVSQNKQKRGSVSANMDKCTDNKSCPTDKKTSKTQENKNGGTKFWYYEIESESTSTEDEKLKSLPKLVKELHSAWNDVKQLSDNGRGRQLRRGSVVYYGEVNGVSQMLPYQMSNISTSEGFNNNNVKRGEKKDSMNQKKVYRTREASQQNDEMDESEPSNNKIDDSVKLNNKNNNSVKKNNKVIDSLKNKIVETEPIRNKSKFWEYVVETETESEEEVDQTLHKELKILKGPWNNLTDLKNSDSRRRSRSSDVNHREQSTDRAIEKSKKISSKRDMNKNRENQSDMAVDELINENLPESDPKTSRGKKSVEVDPLIDAEKSSKLDTQPRKPKQTKAKYWDYVVETESEEEEIDENLHKELKSLKGPWNNLADLKNSDSKRRSRSVDVCYREDSLDRAIEKSKKILSKRDSHKNDENQSDMEVDKVINDSENTSRIDTQKPKQTRAKYWDYVVETESEDEEMDENLHKELKSLKGPWNNLMDIKNSDSKRRSRSVDVCYREDSLDRAIEKNKKISSKRESHKNDENQSNMEVDEAINDSVPKSDTKTSRGKKSEIDPPIDAEKTSKTDTQQQKPKQTRAKYWDYVVETESEDEEMDENLHKELKSLKGPWNNLTDIKNSDSKRRSRSVDVCYREDSLDRAIAKSKQISSRRDRSKNQSDMEIDELIDENLPKSSAKASKGKKSEVDMPIDAEKTSKTDTQQRKQTKAKYWDYVIETESEDEEMDENLPNELKSLKGPWNNLTDIKNSDSKRRSRSVDVCYREDSPDRAIEKSKQISSKSDRSKNNEHKSEIEVNEMIHDNVPKSDKNSSSDKKSQEVDQGVESENIDENNALQTKPKKKHTKFWEYVLEPEPMDEGVDDNVNSELKNLISPWNSLDVCDSKRRSRSADVSYNENKVYIARKMDMKMTTEAKKTRKSSSKQSEIGETANKRKSRSSLSVCEHNNSDNKQNDTNQTTSIERVNQACENASSNDSDKVKASDSKSLKDAKSCVEDNQNVDLSEGYNVVTDEMDNGKCEKSEQPTALVNKSKQNIKNNKYKKKKFWEYVPVLASEETESPVDKTGNKELLALKTSWIADSEKSLTEHASRTLRRKLSDFNSEKLEKHKNCSGNTESKHNDQKHSNPKDNDTVINNVNKDSNKTVQNTVNSESVKYSPARKQTFETLTVSPGILSAKNSHNISKNTIEGENSELVSIDKNSTKDNVKETRSTSPVFNKPTRSKSPVFGRSPVYKGTPKTPNTKNNSFKEKRQNFETGHQGCKVTQKSPRPKSDNQVMKYENRMQGEEAECKVRGSLKSPSKNQKKVCESEKLCNNKDSVRSPCKVRTPIKSPEPMIVSSPQSGYSTSPRESRIRRWKRKSRESVLDSSDAGSSPGLKRRRLDKLKYVVEKEKSGNSQNSLVKSPIKSLINVNEKSVSHEQNSQLKTIKSSKKTISEGTKNSMLSEENTIISENNDLGFKKNVGDNSYTLQWQQANSSICEESKKVKLNKSWTLISDRSASKLLGSDDDRDSFNGFTEDDVENTHPSDLSYEEHSEVELISSDHEWSLEDEEENVIEKEEEFSKYVPIFSSPGKPSEQDWELNVDSFMQNRVNDRNQSCMSVTSPWRSPRSKSKNRIISPAKVTPKKRQSNFLSRLNNTENNKETNNADREKVDEDIEFNHRSPQKFKCGFSPLRAEKGVIVGHARKHVTSTPSHVKNMKSRDKNFAGLVFNLDDSVNSDSGSNMTSPIQDYRILKKKSDVQKSFSLKYEASPESKKKRKSKT